MELRRIPNKLNKEVIITGRILVVIWNILIGFK